MTILETKPNITNDDEGSLKFEYDNCSEIIDVILEKHLIHKDDLIRAGSGSSITMDGSTMCCVDGATMCQFSCPGGGFG